MSNDSPKKNQDHSIHPKPAQIDNQHLEPLKAKKSPSGQPNLINRVTGVILVLIGIIGCVLTSPLSILGGSIGWLTGMFSKGNPFNSGFLGAKIGSLGAISVLFYGIGLIKGTVEAQEFAHKKSPLIKKESESPAAGINQESKAKAQVPTDPSLSTKSDTKSTSAPFFPKSKEKPKAEDQPKAEEKPETGKKSKPDLELRGFNEPGKIQAFMAKVNAFIAQDEAQVEQQSPEGLPKVSEKYCERLIALIKDPATAEYEFWDRLEQMSNKDIKLFVSKLSSVKERGKFSSSELDYLWRHFHGVELEPSKRENKGQKFALMFSALSEEQLKASFASADFLNLLNKDHYIKAIANTLNRKQLELFAADSKNEETLNSIIKKLKAGPYLLGKLVAIMPYATAKVRVALIEQVAHLPHPASFKIELSKLVDHYVKTNYETYKKQFPPPPITPEKPNPTPSKWKTIKAAAKPIYTEIALKKIAWSDEAFETFIRNLNTSIYTNDEKKIIEDLNSLPDYRVRMIAERATLAEYENLLKNFWIIESKPLNHKSYIDGRVSRLKIILANLSETQLKSSIEENKFWEIFRNTQEPYCNMATEVLSPSQFATIIAHAKLERHADFAILITQIKKDTPAERQRLQKILEAIIPYTTPWFALALERQVKGFLACDKSLYEQLNTDLKKFLSASLERPEVSFKYKREVNLNKKAISQLVIDLHENPCTPTLS